MCSASSAPRGEDDTPLLLALVVQLPLSALCCGVTRSCPSAARLLMLLLLLLLIAKVGCRGCATLLSAPRAVAPEFRVVVACGAAPCAVKVALGNGSDDRDGLSA
jgi:hypothetical protein